MRQEVQVVVPIHSNAPPLLAKTPNPLPRISISGYPGYSPKLFPGIATNEYVRKSPTIQINRPMEGLSTMNEVTLETAEVTEPAKPGRFSRMIKATGRGFVATGRGLIDTDVRDMANGTINACKATGRGVTRLTDNVAARVEVAAENHKSNAVDRHLATAEKLQGKLDKAAVEAPQTF